MEVQKMNKINEVVIEKKERFTEKIKKLFMQKESGEKSVLMEVVIIVVGIGLVVIFRTQITTILEKVFGLVSTAITDLF